MTDTEKNRAYADRVIKGATVLNGFPGAKMQIVLAEKIKDLCDGIDCLTEQLGRHEHVIRDLRGAFDPDFIEIWLSPLTAPIE